MFSIELCRKLVGKSRYVIGFADAYNAFGLIGPEHNGIFILDETKKAVVLDQHMPMATGYFGPEQRHHDEIGRLMKMRGRDFTKFIKSHSRTRPEYNS